MAIYSPDIPSIYIGLYIKLPPGIRTHSFTVSSPWGECRAFSAAEAIHTVPIFRSTWYPLLLCGCVFKACPRLLHMTSAVGIESRIPRSRVQRPHHSAMCFTLRLQRSTRHIMHIYINNFTTDSCHIQLVICQHHSQTTQVIIKL